MTKLQFDQMGFPFGQFTAPVQSIAIGFLQQADQRRYGGLWSELENNFTRGRDHYPQALTNAYNLLLNYKAAPLPPQKRRENDHNEYVSGSECRPNGNPRPRTDGKMS